MMSNRRNGRNSNREVVVDSVDQILDEARPLDNPQPNRGRHSFLQFTSNMGNKTKNYVKSKDIFGQSVNINFAGSGTHKTVPGGLISLFVSLCFYSYSILMFKDMINKESWSLTQQQVLQSSSELEQ